MAWKSFKKWQLILFLVAVFFPVLVGFLCKREKIFYINETNSMPTGLYVKQLKTPNVGDVVVIILDEYWKSYAENRGYVAQNQPLIKRVVAKEGDYVCQKNMSLFVNDAWVAQVRHEDSSGRHLLIFKSCRKLSKDEFFVMGDNLEQSFDSRCFGIINDTQILSVVKPFVLNS